jgi:hypothetical protein
MRRNGTSDYIVLVTNNCVDLMVLVLISVVGLADRKHEHSAEILCRLYPPFTTQDGVATNGSAFSISSLFEIWLGSSIRVVMVVVVVKTVLVVL